MVHCLTLSYVALGSSEVSVSHIPSVVWGGHLIEFSPPCASFLTMARAGSAGAAVLGEEHAQQEGTFPIAFWQGARVPLLALLCCLRVLGF